MRFWTVPVIISSKHAFNAPIFRELDRIFEANELRLFDLDLLFVVATIGHNIVMLDI